MPYITREDGEHFVIPSYRDVLTVKQKSQLKKDILLLSQSYGEYITLQKKSAAHYEVAFSPDTGYLLGESIWHHFKRPLDMIYCEAIPNTTEALLVIVKAGSVYLDGSFPLDSIPEELIIFLTQQNNFEIYTYGDVPISETPESGKFSFEASSVKAFKILEKPVFPTLPLLRIYQLQLVDPVLKAQGIGVFPTRQVITVVIIAGLLWMVWSYLTTKRTEVPTAAPVANPYQVYFDTLSSPAPEQEVNQLLDTMNVLGTMPGWTIKDINYSNEAVTASVVSRGGKTEDLFAWAATQHITVNLKKDGIEITTSITVPNRSKPTKIYGIKDVIALFIDRLATVYPGNHLTLSDVTSKGKFKDVSITMALENVSPLVMQLIGKQFRDLPLVLHDIKLNMQQGNNTFNGSITIEALGS
jgi:hypothetical protein